MNGKIALEEHFNLPEFNVPQYVSPEMMREISRRLLDVTTMRLAEMDAAGIDYSLQSLNAPGVQGEPDQTVPSPAPGRSTTRWPRSSPPTPPATAGSPPRACRIRPRPRPNSIAARPNSGFPA